MTRSVRNTLIFSLIFNLLAAVGIARVIYLRGGWRYLESRASGMEPMPQVDPADVVSFGTRETLFEVLPVRLGKIVFLGDSHTANCEWSEFFPEALNRGIGGDTSAGVLKRISSIIRLKPRVVFLMIGSNDRADLGLVPEQTVANIKAAVSEIRRQSPQTVIYLESLLPSWKPKENVDALAINEELQRWADGKQVVYIDMYKDFLDGNLLARTLTADGEHLTGAGYLIWKHKIEGLLSGREKPTLPKRIKEERASSEQGSHHE